MSTMDVRSMPKGWRMLAMFPMVASSSDGNGGQHVGSGGVVVMAECVVIAGVDSVYVCGYTIDSHATEPESWTEVTLRTDHNEAMRIALGRAGWSGAIH